MGALAGIGTELAGVFAGGAGTAAGAARGSMGFGALATGLSAGGSILGGIGGLQQGLFAAHVARMNATAARLAGQQAEISSKLKYGALEATQKAEQAANGVDVGSGSAVAVRRSTEEVGAMDAALIHYNAAREAWGQTAQASLDTKAGVGALEGGILGAGNSLLSGAQSLTDKWLIYKRIGAMG